MPLFFFDWTFFLLIPALILGARAEGAVGIQEIQPGGRGRRPARGPGGQADPGP